MRKTYHPRWNTLNYKPLNGIKIFFDQTGPWQSKMIDNSYDTYLFDRVRKMDLKNKVIFDIGAHIGFHSFYFSRLVGPGGKVYAFEPNKYNLERFGLILDNNKDLKQNISIFDSAISDKTGISEFNINSDVESGRSSGNFIDSADTFWSRKTYDQKGFKKTQVKTVSLDSISKELGIYDQPDIIKIDVEGAENLVLSGATQTLTSKRPILFVEIHSISNMFRVTKTLTSLGYKTEMINTDPNGICFIEAKPQ